MPTTRWPDNNFRVPPRLSAIVITHKQGKVIGEA
jgi:secreted PhoX family phosphatase